MKRRTLFSVIAGGIAGLFMPKPASAEPTLEDVVASIEEIVDDDLCYDWEATAAFHPEELSERETKMQNKISRIYQIAHSYNKRHSCYRVHDDWRKLVTSKPDYFADNYDLKGRAIFFRARERKL